MKNMVSYSVRNNCATATRNDGTILVSIKLSEAIFNFQASFK